MDALTAFGLFAVTAMLVCYALEERSAWFIFAFAGSCGLGSAYGFLQGAWPFGLIGQYGPWSRYIAGISSTRLKSSVSASFRLQSGCVPLINKG